MPASPPSSATERLPQLDGLRGVAVLFVVWHHFGLHLPGWLDWGPVAPNIFFLLTGYLITQSMLRMREQPRPGGLFSYHARRFARLLPALYLMLAVGWLAGVAEFRDGLPWHAAFASNFQMIANDDWSGSVSHLWSLSVQEQFYLLWPLILFLPARCLLPSLLILLAGAAVFRAWCLHAGMSEFFRWLLLPSSLDTFAAGALIAWLGARRNAAPLLPSRWRLPAAAGALACWFIARGLRGSYGSASPGLAFIDTFETIFFAWLLIELLQGQGLIGRAFSFRPLCQIGRISYGVYIWHMLVALAMSPHLDALGLSVADHNIARAAVLTAASVGVAALSWIAVEKPFIAWGRRLSAPEGILVNARVRLARILGRTEAA